jgi:hypothetical protein
VNLVSVFNNKSKKEFKKQALMEVNFGGVKLDQVLLSAQLLTEVILRLHFLIHYEAEIRFQIEE